MRPHKKATELTRAEIAPEVHDMQDVPAKKSGFADAKKPEEFGELEEILEWEDEIDLAKEIAEIDTDDSPAQDSSLERIERADEIPVSSAQKSARRADEKIDIREDISQDFFAVKHSNKKRGLLQAAEKLRNIPGFDSGGTEDKVARHFSITVPHFGEEEISVNKKIATNKKSLLAKAMSIASVSSEVIFQGADGIFSIKENLEMRGVRQDDSLRELVDSVLKH